VSFKGIGAGLIIAGTLLALIGVLFYFNFLSWFGKLPGDIQYKSEHVQFYFPITTMILVSLLISVILYLARRFF